MRTLKSLVFWALPCLHDAMGALCMTVSALSTEFQMGVLQKLSNSLCFCFANLWRVSMISLGFWLWREAELKEDFHTHIWTLLLSSKSSSNSYAIPENNFNLFSMKRLVKCYHITFSHYVVYRVILWPESSRHALLMSRAMFSELKNSQTTTVKVMKNMFRILFDIIVLSYIFLLPKKISVSYSLMEGINEVTRNIGYQNIML